MNLFINSPAYFTQTYGVISEIYDLCKEISTIIDIKKYTDLIDTIAIIPIIAPDQFIKQGLWKEEKKISLSYRLAIISLQTDYGRFCEANLKQKEMIILDNIFQSLKIIKRRLKNNFNYDQMESDIISCVSQWLHEDISIENFCLDI